MDEESRENPKNRDVRHLVPKHVKNPFKRPPPPEEVAPPEAAYTTAETPAPTALPEVATSPMPEALRRAVKPVLPPDFTADRGVTVMLPLEVRKPRRDEWIKRLYVECAENVTFSAIEFEEQTFLITPDLAHGAIRTSVFEVAVEVMVTSAGKRFVWLRRMPDQTTRRPLRAHVDAASAAKLARTSWVRIYWSTADKAYSVQTPDGTINEREPPAGNLETAVSTALLERLIDTVHHPVVRSLHGLE